MKAILPAAILLIGLVGCKDQSTKDRYAELSAEISQLRESNAKNEQSLAKLHERNVSIAEELKMLKSQLHAEIITGKVTAKIIEIAGNSSGEKQSVVTISPDGLKFSKDDSVILVGNRWGTPGYGVFLLGPSSELTTAISEDGAILMLRSGEQNTASLVGHKLGSHLVLSQKTPAGIFNIAELHSTSQTAAVRVGTSSKPNQFEAEKLDRLFTAGLVDGIIGIALTEENYSTLIRSGQQLIQKKDKNMIKIAAMEHMNGIMVSDPAGRNGGGVFIVSQDGQGKVAVQDTGNGYNILAPAQRE